MAYFIFFVYSWKLSVYFLYLQRISIRTRCLRCSEPYVDSGCRIGQSILNSLRNFLAFTEISEPFPCVLHVHCEIPMGIFLLFPAV